MGDITELIRASNDGDQAALGSLFQLLYADLRVIAHRRIQLNGSVTSHVLVALVIAMGLTVPLLTAVSMRVVSLLKANSASR